MPGKGSKFQRDVTFLKLAGMRFQAAKRFLLAIPEHRRDGYLRAFEEALDGAPIGAQVCPLCLSPRPPHGPCACPSHAAVKPKNLVAYLRNRGTLPVD